MNLSISQATFSNVALLGVSLTCTQANGPTVCVQRLDRSRWTGKRRYKAACEHFGLHPGLLLHPDDKREVTKLLVNILVCILLIQEKLQSCF